MGHTYPAVVIEDDDDVGELTELLLVRSGFTVHRACDGPSGIEAVREHDPILTTLDLQMPGLDGFVVAERLRAFSQTYLIMITSRAEEADVIAGFEAGADDYLTKPFRPRELLARAEATLRRTRAGAGGAEAAPPEPWVTAAVRTMRESAAGGTTATVSMVDRATAAGDTGTSGTTDPAHQPDPADSGGAGHHEIHRFSDLELDAATGLVRLGGRGIQLDREEADLLSALMVTGRRVRSKADLALALHGQTLETSYFVKEADKSVVDHHITGLRRKLGDDDSRPRFIEPVRGVGYRMAG